MPPKKTLTIEAIKKLLKLELKNRQDQFSQSVLEDQIEDTSNISEMIWAFEKLEIISGQSIKDGNFKFFESKSDDCLSKNNYHIDKGTTEYNAFNREYLKLWQYLFGYLKGLYTGEIDDAFSYFSQIKDQDSEPSERGIGNNSRNTIKTYSKTIEYYDEAVGLDYAIEDHTSAHTSKFTTFLKNNNIKEQTRIKYVRQLQVFFNWACDELRIVKINLRNNAPSKEEIETFTSQELENLKTFILEKHKRAKTTNQKMTFYNDYRAYMLLKNSGFRRAEALTLTLDKILLGEADDKEIRVRENEYFGFVPKGNKKRSLPIVDERFKTFLIEDISGRSENEKYYLDNGKGEPYLTSYDRFTARFKEYCVSLGIAQKKPRLKPLHAFRATYITYLVNKGVNIFTIMKIVGHESIETTQRYVNQNKDQIREALTRLND